MKKLIFFLFLLFAVNIFAQPGYPYIQQKTVAGDTLNLDFINSEFKYLIITVKDTSATPDTLLVESNNWVSNSSYWSPVGTRDLETFSNTTQMYAKNDSTTYNWLVLEPHPRLIRIFQKTSTGDTIWLIVKTYGY